MTIAKNDNQQQDNTFDINVKFKEVLALAEEIKQLTKSEEDYPVDSDGCPR